MSNPVATVGFNDAPVTPRTLRVGDVIDERYRLEALIGEGGMGAVWRATQLSLARSVAIKLLHVVEADRRERLRREALALASIVHPSIVAVFDHAVTPAGMPYLVMELVAGESLETVVARRGPLPAREAVSLMLPVLDALSYAHDRGVIHRDLKPSNVLLAQSDDGVTPKVVDFGIALLGAAGGARLTGALVIGTPTYMAPEQLRGVDLDARVDVWGAGCLLYEMLTGKAPFAGTELAAVMHKILDAPLRYPLEVDGLDGPLWSILNDALRKDRRDRTPSAAAFRKSLFAWSEQRARAELASNTTERSEPGRAPDDRDRVESSAMGSFDGLVRRRFGEGR